jgi:hypothetical protein
MNFMLCTKVFVEGMLTSFVGSCSGFNDLPVVDVSRCTDLISDTKYTALKVVEKFIVSGLATEKDNTPTCSSDMSGTDRRVLRIPSRRIKKFTASLSDIT